MKRKGNKGFTLIELLVVIAIIGILSSVVLASLNTARQKSRDAKRISDIKQLQLALEFYYDANNGTYPTALDAASLVTPGYIATIPTPPSGAGETAYRYAAHPATNPTTYHIGVTLEDDGNIVLSGDKDCNSTTAVNNGCPVANSVYGAGTPFDGTVAELYDLVP